MRETQISAIIEESLDTDAGLLPTQSLPRIGIGRIPTVAALACVAVVVLIFSVTTKPFGSQTNRSLGGPKKTELADLFRLDGSRCTASFGATIGSPCCCGQPCNVSIFAHVCAAAAPICTGLINDRKWGTCSPIPCLANYGSILGSPKCCGQPGEVESLEHVCLPSAPICQGFINGSAWGTCVEPSTATKTATASTGTTTSATPTVTAVAPTGNATTQCTADQGSVVGSPCCCGQPCNVSLLSHVCSVGNRPICSGFVNGSAWGTCVPICSIAMLVPTLGSAEVDGLLKTLFVSAATTASGQCRLGFFLAYDSVDGFFTQAPNRQTVEEMFSTTLGRNPHSLHWVVNTAGRTYVNAVNYAAASAASLGFNYLFVVGDDIQFMTPGWDTSFYWALVSMQNVGAVGPNQLRNYGSSGRWFLEETFVGRSHLCLFGTFFPPNLKNWWSDVWISQVYNDLGRLKKFWNIAVNNARGRRYAVDYSGKVWWKSAVSTYYGAAVPKVETCVNAFN